MQLYSEEQRARRRNKKLLLLLLIVAGVLLVAFVLAPKLRQTDKPAPSTQQDASSGSTEQKVRAYDSEKYVFGMPENWRPLEQDEIKSLNASGGIKSNDNKALATMTIASKALDTDELVSDLEKRQKSLQGYQKISANEVKIGDHQGVQFTYTYTNNSVSTQQTIYAASVKGEVYYLAFTAAKDDYDQYKDEWAKILAAYRIK